MSVDVITTGELIGTALAAMMAGLAHRVGRKNNKEIKINHGSETTLGTAIHDFQEYQRLRNHDLINQQVRFEALIRLWFWEQSKDVKWLSLSDEELGKMLEILVRESRHSKLD